ncbi:hypothetical protein Pla175_29080 [Pirellulimonas nuda]|uniref:Uncharacterized protein n=1 Tax=Pirellulimonas nuda TaxID=2528009 RepID=A0A518DDJ3_9BACT|nr:hypothetical protein Pla175_29080 [Pirellulimonas nuda]
MQDKDLDQHPLGQEPPWRVAEHPEETPAAAGCPECGL